MVSMEAENGNNVTLYGFESRDVDRRRTDREHTHDIKSLWQRNHEIIGLAVNGLKGTEIAKILGISPVTVSNTLNSTLGKKKISEMRRKRDGNYLDVAKRIAQIRDRGLDTYEELLDDEKVDPKLRKEVADTVVLDIAGMRAPARTEARNINIHATPEEIEEFKRRGIEAAKRAGKLIVIPDEGKHSSDVAEDA